MIIKNNNTINAYQKTSINNNIDTKKSAANNNSATHLVPKSDTVSLSDEARLRTQAYSDASNAPDVRAEKVNQLKEQINNGTYTANSMRTAKAMVSDMVSTKSLYV